MRTARSREQDQCIMNLSLLFRRGNYSSRDTITGKMPTLCHNVPFAKENHISNEEQVGEIRPLCSAARSQADSKRATLSG
jgi:hypothetical protein